MSPRASRVAGQTLVFYGDGKGKTSAALGVALRAVGALVAIGDRRAVEPLIEMTRKRPPQLVAQVLYALASLGGIGFVNIFGDPFTLEQHRDAAQRGLELYTERAASGEYDLIILDEAIGAVSQGQWDLDQLIAVIHDKPRELNLLITGHDDEKKFIDQVIAIADLVTEMKQVKHPFRKGVKAQPGVEF